ncbi:MAG: ABC transporter permease [Clostridiales bacterium]|nr:ABC transporter permease [Clostridiales bacterium]
MMFTYYLRKTLRDKGYLFWSLAFPLLLMICFNVTFMGPAKGEVDFQPVKSAVIRVDTTASNEDVIRADQAGTGEEYSAADAFAGEFENVLTNLADAETVRNSNMGYNHAVVELIRTDSQADAEKKILDKEIEVLFMVDGAKECIEVKVGDNANMTTLMVARSIVESYRRNYTIMKDAAVTAPDKLEAVMNSIADQISVMKPKSTYLGEDGSSANVYAWYFYSTIVMGMFFNVTSGIHTVFDIQGNLSGYGMRTSVSPKKKSQILLSAFMARYVIACAITFFHLFALRAFFQIPVGNRLPQILLFVLVGNLFSMSLGSLFGLFTKGDENQRDNKATAIVMLSVFLSGEMIVQLPGLLEKYCPIINRINPATIMNFAFFRLVNYPTLRAFWMNMIKIAIATVGFLVVAILKLRREKYAAV